MKKIMTAVLMVVMLLGILTPMSVMAGAVVEGIEYEGRGYVDIDFRGRVQYKNAKVTVKDSSGKSYTARITEKDSDDLSFKVSSIQSNKQYTFTISGVRAKGETAYSAVSGRFSTPSASKVQIESIEYEGKGRVEVDFLRNVQYKSAKVSVKDSSGKQYTARIVEKDGDDMAFKVSNIKSGMKYSFTISGVRLKNTGSYASVSGTFYAASRR